MNTSDGKEKFALEIDLKGFERDINTANNAFNSLGDTAEQEGKRIDNTFSSLGRKVAGAFAVGSLVEFERKIIGVRSEMESLQISFETLAGKQVGRQLYNDIKQFAAVTPMLMGDLSKGAQTLLGFGIEAEKVMPILRQIGDISMGDAQRFNSLSLAFAQMSSTGKLMGQDLLQMINAGFNPLTIIAEKTGKNMADLKDEMSKGKISVEMVEDAFRSATSEGGKFNGMLEKQGKGMKGAIAQMEGAFENAMNGFGDQQEGMLVDGIHLITEAINHYEELGKVILTVAAAYGSWKGAQMLIVAYQNTIAKQTAAVEAQRVASLQAIANEYTAEAASENTNTAATQANTAAKEGNMSAIDAEVLAIENELRAKLAVAEANYNEATSQAAAAALKADAAKDAVKAAEEVYQSTLKSGNGEAIEAADIELNTAARNANSAETELQAARKEVATAATAKEAAATRLSSFQTQVDTANKQANTAATGIWAAVTRSATAALNGLKAAMAANPFGLALVAVTSIIGLLSLFRDETEGATDALGKLRDAVMEDTSKLNTYRAILDTVDKKSRQYTDAMNKYNAVASEYHTSLLTENDTLEEQRRKYEELTAAIKSNAAQKLLAEAASKADEDSMKAEKDAMDELVKAAEEASYTVIEEGAVYAGDKIITAYTTVEKASKNIREITTATWNAISQNIMEHSRDFTAAANQGETAYKKAIDNQVAEIEKMLKALGVTDKELTEFHNSLHDYVQASADGFQTAYRELDRSEAQLNGIAAAAVNAKDVTNDAIDQMNYEQLQDELIKVQKEIDNINNKPADVQVKDTRLKELRDLLVQINGLIPKQLTEGSDSALEARLKKLKDDRDALVYGSTEWKAKNAEISTLSNTINSHKKNYAENAQKSENSANSAAHKAAEYKKKQQEYLDLQKELADEREKNEFDLWAQTEQATIDTMRDGTEKTLRQIELDFAQRKEELRQQYKELRRQKFEEDKRLWEANPANKNTPFSGKIEDSKYDPTEAEAKKFEELGNAAHQYYLNQLKDARDNDLQAMRDYLKEYGTYQQKKLAIAEEYANKIRNAQSEGEKLTLEKQQQAEIQKVEIEALKQDIDWKGLLGDFGGMFEEQLKPTLDKLKAYTESDEFKQADINDQKTVYDLINQLQEKTSDGWSGMFRDLGSAVQKVKDAELEQEAAKQKSIKADEEYAEAVKRNTVLGKNGNYVDDSNGEVAAAFSRAQEAANELTESQTKLTNAQNEASDAASRVRNNMDNLVNGLQQLGSGSMSGVLSGANSIASIFGDKNFSGTLGKELAAGATKVFGKAVGDALGGPMGGDIVEGVFALLDLFKDGIENLFSNLIDTVLGAVNGLLKTALSLDVPKAIGLSLRDGLENITNTLVKGLSFGTLDGINWSGSNAKEVAETTNRLTDANERLKVSIDGLKDEISASVGVNSIKSADEAVNAQKQLIENQREILKAQQGYHSAHHSNAYYWNLGYDMQGQINSWLAEYARKNGTSASTVGSDWGSFAKLSPEEMDYLRKHDAVLWQTLTEIGKYDKSEYFDAFADLAGSVEEITSTLYESLTTTTKENVFEDFLNNLYDLADGSEDVFDNIAENWQKMQNRMAVNNLVGAKFQQNLESWYEDLAKANEAKTNGEFTDAEYKKRLDALKAQYDDYAQKAKNDIDALREAGIIASVGDTDESTDQSSTKKGFATASQDSVDELNGRLSGLMMIEEQSRGILETSATDIAAIREYQGQSISIAQEIRNLAVLMVSHLEDISKYTKHLIQIDETVQYFRTKIN